MAAALAQRQKQSNREQQCNCDSSRDRNWPARAAQKSHFGLDKLDKTPTVGAQNRGHGAGIAGFRVDSHYQLRVLGLVQNPIDNVEKPVAGPALAHYFGARLAEQK